MSFADSGFTNGTAYYDPDGFGVFEIIIRAEDAAGNYTLEETHSVSNCGEIWSAREAILNGAKFDELSLSTYWNGKGGSRSLGDYMPKCKNCQFTFGSGE